MLFLLIMLIFFTARQSNPSPFGIIKKYNLLFKVWILFWNISRICFFFYNIQNLKSNSYIIFLKLFLTIFFWWKLYSFLVIFIHKRLNFCYYLWVFFCFFVILHYYYNVLKAFIIFFIDGIYYCFFALYPTRSIIEKLINEHNWTQTHYLLLIQNYFGIYLYINQKVIL